MVRGVASLLLVALFVPSVNAEITGTDKFPFDASPGECFAKVTAPAQYTTKTEKVMVKPEKTVQKVIPAKYDFDEKRILIKEATKKLQVVPATYKWGEEKVLVKPASKKIKTIPAVYKTEIQKVVDTPAHSKWKKGRGPIERMDNQTGEIMCKVEVPATYKQIKKQVLVTPATQQEIEIPAVYKTVRKQVIDKPASVKEVEIPAKYETIRIQKIASPATVQKNTVPAEYRDVITKVKTADARSEWKSILCETNMSRSKITQLQTALKAAGYNPGDVDGIFGASTQQAMKKYQADKNIAAGNITLETLKMLGVNLTTTS